MWGLLCQKRLDVDTNDDLFITQVDFAFELIHGEALQTDFADSWQADFAIGHDR